MAKKPAASKPGDTKQPGKTKQTRYGDILYEVAEPAIARITPALKAAGVPVN